MPMSLDLGDILLVALATHTPAGHEQEGYRPAITVGIPERLGRLRFPMIVVAPLTTQDGEWVTRNPDVYPRLRSGSGGLPQASVVLLDNLRGIDARRVVRYIGSLTSEEFAPVRVGLRRMLGLET